MLTWVVVIWFQSFTLKMYPAELSLKALICFIGTIGGAAVSFVMERDMNAWKIGWDSSLLAAVYSVSARRKAKSMNLK